MSYQKTTIQKAMKHIYERKYLLPSIQPEFVWKTEQIELLFDSLMRGYPISTFLFWSVKKENISKFQFYEFLTDYHERDNRHNKKINAEAYQDDIIALLDGQQRLTSLYIGLYGTYTKKLPYKWSNNDEAWPERNLYLNILNNSENEVTGKKYDFRFLTNEDTKSNDEHHWFKCSEIINFDSSFKVLEYSQSNELGSESTEILSKLQEVIHNKEIINYYLEESTELDKVLQIFKRWSKK